MIPYRISLPLLLALAVAACGDTAQRSVEEGMGPEPVLDEPRKRLIPTMKIAEPKGWNGHMPTPVAGARVTAFARDLDNPRWLYVLPNGDVLVAESSSPETSEGRKGIRGMVMNWAMARAGSGRPSAERITLLRDADGDGVAELRSAFIENLYSPFGMALVGEDLYVANTDGVVRFPYREGDTRIEAPGEPVFALPAGELNHHWTKGLIASPDGETLYATAGSNSNVAENGLEAEEGRAAVWAIDRRSGQGRLFATGLRNPNGLAWEPVSGKLWTTVNERDEIGSDLVPDYMTSVQEGGFYGWPYSYFGQHVDTRVKPPRPDLVAEAIVPDYALGAHTASLGLAWGGDEVDLPPPFQNGMFIGQRGSWNRNPPSGYRVIFVPFADGAPDGEALTLLDGFLADDGDAYGRPVGVAIDGRGGVLVADDVGNTVWRVSAAR